MCLREFILFCSLEPLLIVFLLSLPCDYSGDRVVALLEQAWDVKTLAGFRVTESIWLEYVNLHNISDPYLTVCTVEKGIGLVMEFIVYLEDVMGFTGPQIGKSLTNLRGTIIIYGGCASVFSSEALAVVRRAVRNIHASIFASSILLDGPKKAIVQLPICVEFMDRLREWYWHGGSTLTDKMIYIASMIAFLRGLRISNVASTGPKAIDHRYYLRSVDLEIELGIVSVSRWKDLGSPPVLAVKLTCVSSKTHGPTKAKKTVPPIVMIAGIGSLHECMLMSDFVTWLSISGMYNDNDLLFARWDTVHNRKTPTLKRLTSKDVSTALKRVAESFGFNAQQFSTRSIRIGANVELSAQGASDGQRMTCLDHVTLSSNVMYMRSLLNHDPTPLSSEGMLSVEGVKKMARYL